MNRPENELRAAPRQTMPPRTFADVIGHEKAVEGLRNRFASQGHSTGVILYGPAGVGKRTLARVYARTLLCEGLLGAGASPCMDCEACKSFETHGSFGVIELDAAGENAIENMRKIVADLRYQPLAKHRVCVVANADDGVAGAVDALLKTLEENPVSTTFIFLARNLKNVRATGRSRCVAYRLRPLSTAESKRLCVAMLMSYGAVCDDESALNVLAASGYGLPGRLQESCGKVARAEFFTLENIRRVLGFDWVNPSISYWRTLLGKAHPADSALELPLDVTAREAVRRVRVILEQLQYGCQRAIPPWPVTEPALMHLDLSPLSELVVLLGGRAVESGLPIDDLWAALADHWIKDDYADAAGFLDAGFKSRQIILGRSIKTFGA